MKKSDTKEKEKHGENQVRKRKTELEELNTIETKETRTRRKWADDSPQSKTRDSGYNFIVRTS